MLSAQVITLYVTVNASSVYTLQTPKNLRLTTSGRICIAERKTDDVLTEE